MLYIFQRKAKFISIISIQFFKQQSRDKICQCGLTGACVSCVHGEKMSAIMKLYTKLLTFQKIVVSRGAVRSAASSYAAVRMVVGSRPVLVIV